MNVDENLGMGARSKTYCWRIRYIQDWLGRDEESRQSPHSPGAMPTAFTEPIQACSHWGVHCTCKKVLRDHRLRWGVVAIPYVSGLSSH